MSGRITFAALFVLLIVSSTASAASDDSALSMFFPTPHSAWALSVCGPDKFYNAQSRDAPAPVATALTGVGRNLTFRACTDSDRNAHYFLRMLQPSSAGLCRVSDDEVFVGRKPDVSIVIDISDKGAMTYLAGWTDRTPADWHEVGYYPIRTQLGLLVYPTATCPPVSDPRYRIADATDGMLKGFLQLWRDATVSRAAFDRMFGTVKVRDDMKLGDFDPESDRELLRRWVFEEHASVDKIDCAHGVSYGRGCVARVGVLEIEFDVSESGKLEIIEIGEDREPVW